MRSPAPLLASLALLTLASAASAGDKTADPSTYKAVVATLTAGDTLHLAAGTYPDHLSLTQLNGTPSQWITITGPDTGPPAVFVADPGPCCNTVEIVDSSYLAIEHLTINGNHVEGAFGVSAKQGIVHHIRVEACDFLDHDGSQQTVAISTKVTTWGWEIRNNRIKNTGTGLYLGNSTGDSPFIGGLIEGNLVEDPIGYCMEIKWQKPRPMVPGIPVDPTTTIIRDNVFIKTDKPSPDGDRPNLLVGGFPQTGPGSQDRYEIYGNLFYHNPRESLFQGSGRVTLHDNIFVDVKGTAMLLQDHDLPLSLATVYNNTIFQAGTGIHFGSAAPMGDAVFGNLIFADTSISGTISDQRDNLTGAVAAASGFVAAPSTTLGQMDFYPLAGKCTGPSLDATKVLGDTDNAIDFNGAPTGDRTFRGAYSGEGKNPGWALGEGPKPLGGSAASGSGGGSTGSGTGTGTGTGAGAGAGGGAISGAGGGGGSGANGGDASSGGCGCRTAGDRHSPWAWTGALVALGLAAARRRRGREIR
jgi:MYXO-CTERM domain-containing protein